MTGGMMVVDDAGHFGGNMGEQFTAATRYPAPAWRRAVSRPMPLIGAGNQRDGCACKFCAHFGSFRWWKRFRKPG